ncbi:hypothetical protein [Sinosporangium siamense]|uniref:Uncharacterized protein n=1 Tax=Sinosporangium siamense TaxID=1367973 RepID=A0A919RNW3_9ACTN|nr:hypothetical protein [Sinosporangium siamense]GII95454.1 hypothetical protein Ssi02_56850 [Sinosporangium siamense]
MTSPRTDWTHARAVAAASAVTGVILLSAFAVSFFGGTPAPPVPTPVPTSPVPEPTPIAGNRPPSGPMPHSVKGREGRELRGAVTAVDPEGHRLTYAVESGLPPGARLARDGSLSGVPTRTGHYLSIVQVCDERSACTSGQVGFTIRSRR